MKFLLQTQPIGKNIIGNQFVLLTGLLLFLNFMKLTSLISMKKKQPI